MRRNNFDMQVEVVQSSHAVFKVLCLEGINIDDLVECYSKSEALTIGKKYKVLEIITESKVPMLRDDEGIRIPVWKNNFKKLEGSIDFIVNK